MPDRMFRLTLVILTLTALVALALLFASDSPEKNAPLAEVNGEVITAAELERAVGPSLAKLQEQIYALKKEKLEGLIEERLLKSEAEKRGVAVEALLQAEIEGQVQPVSDEEVKAFYAANKARLRGEESGLIEPIRSYLREQKIEARRKAFLAQLRAQAEVVIHLEAPEVYRAEVGVEGAPFRGAEGAPVTIVKFEDFHCPYCRRVQATLGELLTRYDGKLKIVHRDFPLDTVHPQARAAHEAARCAGEQGKFWAYHDTLFANGPKSAPEDLKRFAGETGLDPAKFNECLESGRTRAAIEADVEEGQRLGLTGTPAFLINGRMLSGAQPIEKFAEVIDQELARRR
ncbi:MAG: thioredoxin domain-containing protein [Candidatus Acidiferrales bacterium]